jgi:hypothetical protein
MMPEIWLPKDLILYKGSHAFGVAFCCESMRFNVGNADETNCSVRVILCLNVASNTHSALLLDFHSD